MLPDESMAVRGLHTVLTAESHVEVETGFGMAPTMGMKGAWPFPCLRGDTGDGRLPYQTPLARALTPSARTVS